MDLARPIFIRTHEKKEKKDDINIIKLCRSIPIHIFNVNGILTASCIFTYQENALLK